MKAIRQAQVDDRDLLRIDGNELEQALSGKRRIADKSRVSLKDVPLDVPVIHGSSQVAAGHFKSLGIVDCYHPGTPAAEKRGIGGRVK